MSDADDVRLGEPRHEHNAASLRSALEHVCAHDDRAILLIRVGIGRNNALEVVMTSCGRDCTEEQEMRIAKALLPEVARLVRAIVKRRAGARGEEVGRER